MAEDSPTPPPANDAPRKTPEEPAEDAVETPDEDASGQPPEEAAEDAVETPDAAGEHADEFFDKPVEPLFPSSADDAPKYPFRPEDVGETFEDGAPDPEDLAALEGWEPEATPGSLVALLPHKWVRRLVLGAIPVLALFFGSGLILASQLSVTHALQVFGTAATKGATSAKELQAGKVEALLVAGRANALRVAIWNRRKKLHERHFQATLTLQGGPGNVSHPCFSGVAGPGPALEARFPLPDLAPGRYTLVAQATYDGETYRARIPAQVVRPPVSRPAVPIETLKPEERHRPPPPDPDYVSVEILPSSGHRIVSELAERLTVRATDDQGAPIRLRGALRLAAGRLLDAEKGQRVGRAFETDPLGLHSLRIVSRHPQLALRLTYQAFAGGRLAAARPERERVIRFRRRNAQALLVPEQLIVAPGAELAATVYTLTSSGYVYLDLYQGGRRYHSASFYAQGHRQRVRLPAPRQPGLFRIQATDDFTNPGTGIVTRTLFASRAAPRAALPALARAVRDALPASDRRTARHLDVLLREKLLGAPDVAPRRAAAYFLSRLDHLHYPTDWLADTTASDARALAARRQRLQRVLVIGLAFTALLLLALVGPLVYVNLALARQGTAERDALMAEFEATADAADLEAGLRATRTADGGELITDLRAVRAEKQRMDRLRHRVQIVLVTGIILLTLGAILVLLLRLSWGFG